MPVFRKGTTPPKDSQENIHEPPRNDAAARLPGRIVVLAVIRDESGSMSHWRQRQGDFIPQVAAHLIEVGGPKVGKLVFILYCVISGGVVTTEFVPLEKALDPDFRPDGQTPIGRGLMAVAEKCQLFLEQVVIPQEVTVRNFEILVVSDLQATGESPEETEAGVEAFLAMAKKFNAKLNVVGPDPEAMNGDLAGRLDVSGRGVKYLSSDPKAILAITFDSILAATGPALGGSNPPFRIQ